jgi:hypothetical protein
MKNKIIPIKENEGLGFTYTVTPEQIAAHRQRTLEEIFEWLESGSELIYNLQTEEERKTMKRVKCDKNFRFDEEAFIREFQDKRHL